MAISREEQLRNNRRFSRQIVGAVAIVLIIIGLFTVLSWVVGVLRSALDDTERRQSYADRLYGLVMFDTMPFDDVSKVDQSEFLQAAIWGAVYQIQKRDNGLSDYERDSETGSIILPKLEVDTYLTNLLGPDYKITDGSFQTEEFNYTYDEEKQGYLVPVTSMVAMYTPEVEKISTQSGKTYVTVGYIPTINNSSSGEINLTAPTEPSAVSPVGLPVSATVESRLFCTNSCGSPELVVGAAVEADTSGCISLSCNALRYHLRPSPRVNT